MDFDETVETIVLCLNGCAFFMKLQDEDDSDDESGESEEETPKKVIA